MSHRADVVVAGGGIAGISAAIAAARSGADVILIEREFCLGGMATLGLVTIFLPLDDGRGNQVIFGIGEELLRLSIEHGAEANYPKAWLEGGSLEERMKARFITQFNPHLFALRVEKLLLELGVKVLYGTLAASVIKDGPLISGIVVENKSGRSVIACEAVVDCTGDADIAHMAGAPTALHEKGNGLASWYYYYTGGKVKLKMFGLADLPSSSEASEDDDPYDNVKVVSLAPTRFSGVDGEELSSAVIEAHGKMYEDILKIKSEQPDYVPVTISTIPLVRMSRRIVGAYTQDDTESHVFFEDSIGLTGDWRKAGPCYEIPYRTLYTPAVPNLIVAGRIISVTDDMWDITRVIPPCAVTGQAAGTAASMTKDFPALDVAELQQRLASNNVKLHI
ncbi:MAG: FAD-dependent oxidoreductase [Clostridiales bacterium]|nr:FAD-dependent oxidoreductase [Clostridiales bacterium]